MQAFKRHTGERFNAAIHGDDRWDKNTQREIEAYFASRFRSMEVGRLSTISLHRARRDLHAGAIASVRQMRAHARRYGHRLP